MTPGPRYEAVKQYVRERILSGEWPRDTRIPSENALGPMLGVSRLTVNRAFKELAEEGHLRKVPGVGTFVAENKPRFGLTSIESIAAEIEARGMRWTTEVLSLGPRPCPPEPAAALGLAEATLITASLILHRGDGLPIQLEERHLRPGYAPDYGAQDFSRSTSFDYLARVGLVTEMEQAVTATLPPPEVAGLLAIGPQEPCLLIRRRTFRHDEATTFSRLTQPASRFELAGRYRMQALR